MSGNYPPQPQGPYGGNYSQPQPQQPQSQYFPPQPQGPYGGNYSQPQPQQPQSQYFPPSQVPPPYYPYQPGQQYPLPTPQGKPPKKRTKGLVIGAIILLLVIGLCSGVMHATTTTADTTTTPDTPSATQVPTATPEPTRSPAQLAAAYKSKTTSTTVTTIDKKGNNGQNDEVHFVCTIMSFVKNSSGNTATANVSDVGGYTGSLVQILFTPNTDVTQLNNNDIVEVWGSDQGVATGTNAFGATVQEVVVQVTYLTDKTTGYKANP